MKINLILSSLVLMSSTAWGGVDFSQYELTAEQLDLVQRLEKRGVADEILVKFINSLNAEKAPSIFIPPHTAEDLEAVTVWAEGGAYRSFAKDAGIEFDFHAYMKDCPDLALFGFGRTTGIQYLRNDVLQIFSNTVFKLNAILLANPSRFREAYLQEIQGTQFAKYVIEKEEGNQLVADLTDQ